MTVLAGLHHVQPAMRGAAVGLAARWDEGFPGLRRSYVEDPIRNRSEILGLLG